jgi:hypothetical protein
MAGTKGGWRSASATLFVALLCVGARAQDTSLEAIEEVDPYTRGKPDAMGRLGYVSFGPFHWAEGQTTRDVSETLGGIPIVFIETAHFRLASTLATYKPRGDAIEKAHLDEELARLEKKLPKARSARDLDPWLRAHLYAQRLEELYGDFLARFGIKDEDFAGSEAKRGGAPPMGAGPYLGQREKFTVLLTQTRSAYGRYVRRYLNVEDEFSYRFNFPDCYFYGANFEALKDHDRSFDVALHAGVAGATVYNFLDSFRDCHHAPPVWFKLGVMHWYARKVDARWNQWNAGGPSIPDEDRNWVWEPRVWGLVKNEACPSWEEMMRWKAPEEVGPRDHMIAWSRVDWFFAEKESDLRALLFALSERLPGTAEEREAACYQQQLAAFEKLWSSTPAELDKSWRKWVLRTYPKN